ncbi:hypothetical protein ACFQO7_02905 [Catellatospora aurea]|uniref:Uncharacterized protein n=1 Tax=Catellatospora aurea TaxID=1337874 RepID=A0ABW2GTJ9_9ACTN
MNDRNSTALARLRAADPAPPVLHPHDPYARAMLDRVLAVEDNPPVRPRPARHRLATALAGTVVFAAAGVLAVAEPWAAPAYSVGVNADGSVVVSFRADELTDPAQLNAELAQAGARTVVMGMVPADQCASQPPVDTEYEFPLPGTPEHATSPIDYQLRDEGVYVVIRPQHIPAADQLVIGYAIDGQAHRTMVRPWVVVTVPQCLPRPTPPGGPAN